MQWEVFGDEEQKIAGLTARINKDYTKSSQTEGKKVGENPAGRQDTCIIHANVRKPQTQ